MERRTGKGSEMDNKVWNHFHTRNNRPGLFSLEKTELMGDMTVVQYKQHRQQQSNSFSLPLPIQDLEGIK